MAKSRKIYVYRETGKRMAVMSIRQLSGLTGMSERNLQKVLSGGEFHEKTGKYIIEVYEVEQDGRKKNSNPNMVR